MEGGSEQSVSSPRGPGGRSIHITTQSFPMRPPTGLGTEITVEGEGIPRPESRIAANGRAATTQHGR